MPEIIMSAVSEEEYLSGNGYSLKREHGLAPVVQCSAGNWVLRGTDGEMIDTDQYRHDLAERNGVTLLDLVDRFDTSSRSEYNFSIQVNGVEFLRGDESSVGVIFGNLDRRNFLVSCVSREQTFEQWLEYVQSVYDTELKIGEKIALLNPSGVVIQESRIGTLSVGAVKLGLSSDCNGVSDYTVVGPVDVRRVCVGNGIKKGDIFNVYGPGSSKQGAKWLGSLEKSMGKYLDLRPDTFTVA